MAAPGFSVNDLIQAIGKVKIVYDAFFDEHDSSAAQFRAFRDELANFQLGLQYQQRIMEKYGLQYAGVDSINRTLSKCNRFLTNYEPLLKLRRGSVVGSIKGNYKVARFAFDDDALKDLQNEIQRHQTSLAHFNSLSHLEIIGITRSNGALLPTPISQPAPDPVPFVDPLSPEISPLLSPHPSPNIPQSDPVPVGPSEQHSRSNSSSDARLPSVREDELTILELPGPAINGPLPEPAIRPRPPSLHGGNGPVELEIPRPPSVNKSPGLPPISIISTPDPSNVGVHSPGPMPSLLLPQASLGYTVVEVWLNGKLKWKLTRKAVGVDYPQGREMVIMDENQKIRFQHRIKGSNPQSWFPYTWYPGFEKNFVIDFKPEVPDAHALCFIDSGPKVASPKYVFANKQDFEDFQSQLRGKRLEATFNALRISTAISSKKLGDASQQQLKIWLDESRNVRSVSYYTNVMKPFHHREFPLAMFEPILEQPDKSEDAKWTLNFAGIERRRNSERRYTLTGTGKYGRSPTEATNTIGAPSVFSGGTGVASSASSVITTSSRTTTGLTQHEDSSGQVDDSEDEQALKSLAAQLKFLRVTFSSEKEASRFRATFRRLYDAETGGSQNQYVQFWQMGVVRGRAESVTSAGGSSPTGTPLTRSPVFQPISPDLRASSGRRVPTLRGV